MDANEEVQPARRRRHSEEFKQQVIQACRQPGVSIAAIALHYRLNANLVRRWIAAYEARETMAPAREAMILPSAEFVPLPLQAASPPPPAQEIVIEVRRGAATVTVRWPGSAAADCASWLQRWLR
jgi:transposase